MKIAADSGYQRLKEERISPAHDDAHAGRGQMRTARQKCFTEIRKVGIISVDVRPAGSTGTKTTL